MIINRNILNPNIDFDSCDREKLFSMIDYWKIVLWEGFDMRPGDKICVGTSTVDPYYLSALIASFELGLIVVICQSIKPTTNPYNTKQSLYTDLKLCLYDDFNSNEYSLYVNGLFFKTLAHINVFDTYEIKDHSLYSEIKDKFFPSGKDVALHTTSSGTTGIPTVITKTHEFLIKSSLRQIKVWNLQSDDTVLHTRQIAHGAVLDLFWLPTLIACPKHYTYVVNADSTEDINKWVSIVNNKKVSQIFLTESRNCDKFLQHCPVFEHKINIINGSPIKREWLTLVRQKNINSFLTSYGATELGNAVFINVCNPSTDIENFVPNRYFMPDNTFEIIKNDHRETTFVNHFDNDAVVTLKDHWAQVDSTWWDFLGRTNDYKINDVQFSANIVNNIVKKYLTQDYSLLIDQEYQSMYLAIYEDFEPDTIQLVNQNIGSELSPDLKIDKFAKLDKSMFVTAFRPDDFLLRGYFRNLP